MKKMLIAALCLLTLSGSAMAAQNVPKELPNVRNRNGKYRQHDYRKKQQ